jgi:hypothetical protein
MSLSDFKEIKKSIKKLQDEAKKQVANLFKEAANDLFKENPQLIDFGWEQYTPYFNDGDECIFRTSSGYPRINGYDNNTGDFDEECYTSNGELLPDQTKYPKLTDKQKEALEKKVINFLNNFEDDDYKSMFGDHQQIVVTREGIEVTDYEHD